MFIYFEVVVSAGGVGEARGSFALLKLPWLHDVCVRKTRITRLGNMFFMRLFFT